jgi:hypothetical protein
MIWRKASFHVQLSADMRKAAHNNIYEANDMKKKIIIISIIVIAVLIGVVLLMSPNIDGSLINYTKAEENDGHTTYSGSRESFYYEGSNNFNMSDEVIEDVLDHPDKYTSYWVGISYKNISGHTVYDIKASLPKKYDDLWFDKSSISEWPIDLKGNETRESNVLVMIKTENMNDDEVDRLIKSIGITISARNFDWFPIYASKTIYFEK